MTYTKKIRALSVQPISKGWNQLDRVKFEYVYENGEAQLLEREIYHVDDGATILLYDVMRRTILLVRQFRLPAYLRGDQSQILETPAGFLDGATAEKRIKQEVEEEAGYQIGTPKFLFKALMIPGCVTHAVHFFSAPYTPSDKFSIGGGIKEEGEEIEVVELTIDAALFMIEQGEIVDGKSIILLQYAALHLFARDNC